MNPFETINNNIFTPLNDKFLKPIGNLFEGVSKESIRWVGGAAVDIAKWTERAASDTANFVSNTVKLTAKTADDIVKVATVIPRGLANFTEDAASRAYFAATGKLNFDIIKSGLQVNGGLAGLKPGDILLKQGGIEIGALTSIDGIKKEAGNFVSLIIDGVQVVTNRANHRYVGAGLLGHAAIYIGNGEVAEAVGEGCVINKLREGYNQDFSFYAIRPKDLKLAEKINELARKYANTKRISYSRAGLPGAVVGGTVSSSLFSKPTECKRAALDTGGRVSMFCSEFAAFILNCADDDLGRQRQIKINQDRVTPEEVYVTLRDNSGEFEYVGELHKGVK